MKQSNTISTHKTYAIDIISVIEAHFTFCGVCKSFIIFLILCCLSSGITKLFLCVFQSILSLRFVENKSFSLFLRFPHSYHLLHTSQTYTLSLSVFHLFPPIYKETKFFYTNKTASTRSNSNTTIFVQCMKW